MDLDPLGRKRSIHVFLFISRVLTINLTLTLTLILTNTNTNRRTRVYIPMIHLDFIKHNGGILVRLGVGGPLLGSVKVDTWTPERKHFSFIPFLWFFTGSKSVLWTWSDQSIRLLIQGLVLFGY